MSSSISANTGWALEISLDVQWAHAIAPQAKILLVEARSAYLSDLLSAVNYARNRADVVAVSMSWGGSEFSSEAAYDSYFTSSYGASFFASSGDTGGAIIWPSSSMNVVSVGGTTLTQSGGIYTETAWSGSGGGVSRYEPKPTYQTAAGLTYGKRATPDVSYDADPASGFAVYDSYGYGGWLVVGGTSAGAPQWAAIQALGGSATNDNFYTIYKSAAYSADFRDVTSGNSGSYSASVGYDLTTGIGSPLTRSFGASPTPDFAISALPSSLSINAGTEDTSTVTVTALGGFTGTVDLTTTAPTDLIATLTPATVTDSGTSQLTITVPTSTTAGTYTVTVKGTSGTITHTTTINVQVTTPDFSLSATPQSQTIRRGRTGTAKVTVAPLNDYTGTVTLSATAPAGISCTFNPTSITATGTSTMTISVQNSANRATYTITITGTDASNPSLTHTTTIRVTVR
jgi:subtilase family serine protease